jgi:hypothetical protein
MNKLADWGCEVRMISNSKLPNYRAELMGKEGKSGAKTDDIDAFAIACWYFGTNQKPATSKFATPWSIRLRAFVCGWSTSIGCRTP